MDKQTIDTYDRMAQEYDDETVDFWTQFPTTVLDVFAQHTTGGTVLDVGSGPGRDGLLLTERGFDVLCLDASATMVELCKARGLRAIQGDLLALPFANNSYAGAWAYTSLLHVPKAVLPVALSEIRRVLNPHGYFGIGMIEGVGESYRTSSGVDLPRLFAYYEQREFEQYLATAGFTVTHFESFTPRTKTYLNYVCVAS